MTRIKFNDRLGSRSLHHLNLLVAPVGDDQVIFRFMGKPIPGVARIISESYEKNGKWSCNHWELELAPTVEGFVWSEGWDTGKYLSPSWDSTIRTVQQAAAKWSVLQALTPAAITRFVRSAFPPALINELDAAEQPYPLAPALEQILQAQS